MVLFPYKIRIDETYASPGESTYSFLNRNALTQFEVVREKLNHWFSHYPELERFELKRRLQSKKQFYDTFFELYIHEFFYNKGYQLSVHPQLNNTSKQPDFFVANGNEGKFYLEVKVVHDESDEEGDYKEKQNKIAQELNKLGNFPYWISIRNLDIKKEGSFSIKWVINKILEVAKTFDYLRMVEMSANESLSFENEDFHIKLAFWPRTSSRIEGKNRAVGVHGYFDAGYVDTSEVMSKAIEEKAKKYGKLDHPFVIALNCISSNYLALDDIEILIGKDCTFIKSNKSLGQINKYIFNDGIFSKPIMNNVAALFLTWVSPYHKDDEQWYWCENPKFEEKKFQRSLINQIF